MKMRIGFCVALLVLCGCGSNSPGPDVSLVTMRINGVTALETTATFVLRLENEQPNAVKFNGAVHKIYLNDLYVGKGLSDVAAEVPRLNTITQEVKVHMSNLRLATRIKSIIESESFSYRIESVFHGDSWSKRLHSENGGKLALQDLVPATETSTNAPQLDALQPSQP